MEKKGYIYILTNESFHKSNWIKIGYSDDVERRVRELSNTSVPMPYEVYATYEVPANQGMDKKLHSIIQKLNPNLRINAEREFFEIEPWDAYDILESMATIHGTLDRLHKNEKNSCFKDPEKTTLSDDYSEERLFPEKTYVGELYEKFKNLLLSMYPNLTPVPNKNYVPFKKGKKHNVVSVWPKENSLEIVLNAKIGTIQDETETVYDISNRLWTAAQYAFRFDEETNINIVKSLISQTYEQIK